MNVLWAAWGGLTGYLLGAALRGTVFQMAVPSGQPDRSTCPQCSGPVRLWLPILCERCRNCYGPPFAMEAVTATVLALLLGRFGGRPDTMAVAYFGVLGVLLSAIDIAVQRLPDRLTLPAYPVLLVMLTFPAVGGHDLGSLLRAVLGGLALAAAFLVLALVRPGHMGGGDIKLAGLAGLTLGWFGWPVLIIGTALGFILSGLVSLGLLATKRVTLRSTLCFGPFLVGGALLAMLAVG